MGEAARGRATSKILFGVIALAVVALTISLGNWQTRRGDQKEARQRLLDERERGPIVTLGPESTNGAELEWRTVRATGEFDASRTVLIDNRINAGRPGYHVVTPLRLAGTATYVLVNRGWLPLGPTRADLPPVPAVSGPVTVEGRAVVPSERVFELKAVQTEFHGDKPPVVQNLVVDRIASASGLRLLPVVILQTAAQTHDGLVRDWPLPASGVETHRMYALQWYSFAVLAVVLYAIFLYRTRRTRST